MAERDLATRLKRRATRAGLTVSSALAGALADYLALLARWNRKINLTALPLEPPSDEALDRLILEPLAAARHVRDDDRMVVDVGSGGGSPAIPLKLAVPRLQLLLVEAKVRKSAFLREAVRQLGLAGVGVETNRFEELLARPELHETADLVTVRAVRADRRLLLGVQAFLKPGGRLFWFGGRASDASVDLDPLALIGREVLVPTLGSALTVLKRTR